MKIAKPLADVIDSFSKLPGIGPKTAQRMAYYLLHVPQTQLDEFAESLSGLKKNTVLCSVCKNVAETDPCPICDDNNRESGTILVVEQPLDILAFEKISNFNGVYHVLHGSISPLDNIGPDELYIEDLFKRVKEANGNPIEEIIIATNPTMEGEATAIYLNDKLKEMNEKLASSTGGLKITRLGMGIPTGASLEFADEHTLGQAIEGRRVI